MFVANNVIIGNNVKIQNNVSLYEGVICEDDVFLGPSMVFTNIIDTVGIRALWAHEVQRIWRTSQTYVDMQSNLRRCQKEKIWDRI